MSPVKRLRQQTSNHSMSVILFQYARELLVNSTAKLMVASLSRTRRPERFGGDTVGKYSRNQ